jgi:hypothetical protein
LSIENQEEQVSCMGKLEGLLERNLWGT